MSAQRLTIWQAAYVVARRDFVAILFSRAFIFFLLGPLFPLFVGLMAGGIGAQVQSSTAPPEIGLAMSAADAQAMQRARDELSEDPGLTIPEMVVLQEVEPGQHFDAVEFLSSKKGNISAVVTGSIANPVLTAPGGQLDNWRGSVALVAARASSTSVEPYPEVETVAVASSGATQKRGQMFTAQAGQTLLFLLIMLLAGMVLSNLVEEKGNKIIEVLAAAIPMNAVFLGKLFAMLAVSIVGVTVWAMVGGGIVLLAGTEGTIGGMIDRLPTPGVGWPLFFLFGVIYFAMGYLLLGSIFLSVGSMAATVREVQTLSMPATMAQLMVFFFASFALTDSGGPIELAAIAFPLSSPYAMFARAATQTTLWPHLLALAWQVLWVALFIKAGAALFRKRVMKSGPQALKKRRRSLAAIIRGRPAVQDG
ncbi:MAG TPA: ABC transporter permease [Sphingomonadaceae bacterium]|nr:ABC transporter permease [Sphingomonadaceae bacterium]